MAAKSGLSFITFSIEMFGDEPVGNFKNINYGHHLMDQRMPNPTKSLRSYADRRLPSSDGEFAGNSRTYAGAGTLRYTFGDQFHVIAIQATSACVTHSRIRGTGCLFLRTAHECSITTQCLRLPAGRIESWRHEAG